MEYDGTILKHIAKDLKFKKLYDCELSKESIDFIKAKSDEPEYIIFKDKIPLAENSMDLVIMTFSLEKMPIRKELISEAKRVLKKEGNLIIFIKNKKSVYGLGYYLSNKLFKVNNIENSYIRSGPFEPINISTLKKILRSNNLKINKQKGLFFIPPEI